MVVDETVVRALKRAISAIKHETPRPVSAELLAPLVEVARPGLHMRLDIEATAAIGAPLITVTDKTDLTELLAPLTGRQTEVAKLVIEGLPNRAIAERLGISLATVKDHVHAILDRLEFPSRTALVSATRR